MDITVSESHQSDLFQSHLSDESEPAFRRNGGGSPEREEFEVAGSAGGSSGARHAVLTERSGGSKAPRGWLNLGALKL